MLIFIENTPRSYAWGSRDALPELLGVTPNGEPQAELWLGAHPDAPASIAKAAPKGRTLIDLIESDPERYGVDGARLPFLLKVLAIGAPLSLQVHPDIAQAVAGFAAEEAAGVPRDAPERNYGDPNHKPELLVALNEVTALSGFRPLGEVTADLECLAEASEAGPARHAIEAAAARCRHEEGDDEARRVFMAWALGAGDGVGDALAAIAAAVDRLAAGAESNDASDIGDRCHPERIAALQALIAEHPGDPGILISLMLHLVRLQPGEAIFLGARQLHAYLSGIGVEVMAASDNVLRAGFTQKHVDVAEVSRIVDLAELSTPRIDARELEPGLIAWEPPVPDFRLLRARLCEPGDAAGDDTAPWGEHDRAALLRIEVAYPMMLIVTSGRVRVERRDAEFDEVASARRGQSLYVSAGGAIELSGSGEAFLATVGRGWAGVSQSSSSS